LVAIEQGYVQREIQEAAYRYQQAIENQAKVVVGVNRFRTEAETRPDLLRLDESIRHRQAARLAALRQKREAGAVSAALDNLAGAARATENLLPYILTAVEAYATTGEICHTLRRVWGEYQPTEVL
jgi:methylmalonyl-CoA mutase N-terminal domain/subunit